MRRSCAGRHRWRTEGVDDATRLSSAVARVYPQITAALPFMG
jgi:hypothetical protein